VRYATGEPLLIESPPASGRRGKVLLLTTSPEADWSTLHREATFVPLMQSDADRRRNMRKRLLMGIGLGGAVVGCLAVLVYTFVR